MPSVALVCWTFLQHQTLVRAIVLSMQADAVQQYLGVTCRHAAKAEISCAGNLDSSSTSFSNGQTA